MTKVKYTMPETTETTPDTSFASGLSTPELKLLKEKHRELIDTVDELTKNDMSKFVDLPQIVVVGDQSSGKSSVLESISHVRFPSDQKVCTRFATQLVLSEADEPSMVVTITPHQNASDAEKERLKRFQRVEEGLVDLSPIIDDATREMGLDRFDKLFSEHTLRIEASGPKMPRLSLVDLPGFYLGRSNNQSDKFREMPTKIAHEYMKKENTIILMVVSADIDTTKQQVTHETRLVDKLGHRTIGIITKPDLMQSHSKTDFFANLENRRGTDMYLKHGWYVVRNRATNEPLDFEARDQTEAEFFKTSPWSKVPSKVKGISELKNKLSKVLIDHVSDNLPKIVHELEDLFADKLLYRKSFDDRSNLKAIQMHLEKVQHRFTSLASQAVRGQLDDPRFFIQPRPDMPEDEIILNRNLRARIRKDNREFVKVMQMCGSRSVFEWRLSGSRYLAKTEFTPEEVYLIGKYNAKHPEVLSQAELEERITQMATLYKSMELPGSFHQGLCLKLFKHESAPWESLARTYINHSLELAEKLLLDILDHVTEGDYVLNERIKEKFVKPFIDGQREVLAEKVKEFLPSENQHSFPIALEDAFEQRVHQRSYQRVSAQIKYFQEVEQEAMTKGLEKALKDKLYAQAVVNAHQGTVNGSEIPHIIENMVEYYEMTLDTFVTNLISLGVENQLMVKIPEVFTMARIFNLTDETILYIGEEPDEIRERRETVDVELEQLRKGLEVCRKWRTGSSSIIPVSSGHNSTNGTVE